jgi:hypothetical protein
MASAKRLMDVRHSWRRSSKIAEISVPAWPIPIHHTKLMISKAQPTGMLFPQMPIPFANRIVTAYRNIITTENEMPKAMKYQRGVRSWMTAEILSVTDPGVWPGATTGGRGGTKRGIGTVLTLGPPAASSDCGSWPRTSCAVGC